VHRVPIPIEFAPFRSINAFFRETTIEPLPRTAAKSRFRFRIDAPAFERRRASDRQNGENDDLQSRTIDRSYRRAGDYYTVNKQRDTPRARLERPADPVSVPIDTV